MKKIIALVLTLVMVFALAAVGGTAYAADEGSVYWLNFKPELDEAAQGLAKMYTEKTGVPVKVVTAASGTYSQTLTSEMDKSSAPTLFIIGNQAGVKEWGEYAMDLTDTAIANELNTDAYNLYDEDGRLVSIGYCFECYGIIVNPDLIEAAGHSMDELVNFEGLKAVAEDIHARAAELGFDAFSSSDMDPSSSWRFTGHMANLEYFYEERDAGGWTECPAELTGAYMENFKNLYDLCINNSLTDPKDLATGGHDAEAEFKSGKAAFFVNGSWEYSSLAEKFSDDQIAMIPIYFGVDDANEGLCTGTENYWCVNAEASEEDIAATLAFMNWCVTSEAGTKAMAENMGFTIPFTTAIESPNAFVKQDAAYTESGKTPVSWNFTTMPSENWKNGVGAALTAYAAGTGDWNGVVTAFVDGWATEAALAE